MRLALEIEEKEDAITNMDNVLFDEFQVIDKEVVGSEEPVKTFADTSLRPLIRLPLSSVLPP